MSYFPPWEAIVIWLAVAVLVACLLTFYRR